MPKVNLKIFSNKMFYFITLLVAILTILSDAKCANPTGRKPEKPLFVPSANYPALIHLHPSGYNTELLENAASYPRYAYDHDALEFADQLQRQILFQNGDKRLEILFQNRENEKKSEDSVSGDDNDDQLANSILFHEELKPEFQDLDRRYKRNVIYSTKPAVPQSTRVFNRQREDEKPYPLGLYRPTTWIPYGSLRDTSQSFSGTRMPTNANKFGQSQRRKRKIPQTGNGDDSSFEPNIIRTTRPLETPDFNKEFSDFNFFVPIQTKPLILSSRPKLEPTYSDNAAYSEQLLALMQTEISNNKKMEID